jgi:YfiH family protein
MQRTTSGPLVYYQFQSLLSFRSLGHGVFTRLGGQSRMPWASLNTGHTVGDDEQAVEANHQLICQALGFRRQDLVSPHQVHGTTVRVVGREDRGRVCPSTDALITATPGVTLMLRFADCVPLLLYEPVTQVIGLAHAGWRGTVSGIARATVEAMERAFGCQAPDMFVGIGPAIGPCCYEVGEDVVQAVSQAFPGGSERLVHRAGDRWHLDLWAANRAQLAECGVRQIEVAGMCTACHTHEWFSYRAAGGETGRFGVVVGLRGHRS